MIKLLLLVLFLGLSLLLPLFAAYRHRERAMLIPMAQGALIYLLSTALSNFLSGVAGLTALESAQDKQIYAVLMSLSLTLAVGLLGLFKVYREEKRAELIYAGFALPNTFLYNMNAYGILLYVGTHHSVERLSGRYPAEAAEMLLGHYDAITLGDLALLNVELVLTFLILRSLLTGICRKGKGPLDYVIFLVGLFLFFFCQYCLENRLLVFGAYLLLLLLGYRGELARGKDLLFHKES